MDYQYYTCEYRKATFPYSVAVSYNMLFIEFLQMFFPHLKFKDSLPQII